MTSKGINAETRRAILGAAKAALRDSVADERDPLGALRRTSREIMQSVQGAVASGLPPELEPTFSFNVIFSEAIRSVWIELGGRVEDIPLEFFQEADFRQ